MIGKLLLTLMVIALAALYLRKRYQQDHKNTQRPASLPARTSGNADLDTFLDKARRSAENTPDTASKQGSNQAARTKAVLWTLLGTVLTMSSIASYWYWQDQQRLVTVLLHRSASESPVIYRVPKRNLGNMEFLTDDGIRVTVSANERMEVVGL